MAAPLPEVATRELYNAIPQGLRDWDAKGTLFLERLLMPCEWWLQEFKARQTALPAQLHPETMPDEHLILALPRVGVDEDVRFLYEGRAPRDQRRLLNGGAMAIWRQRYTPTGLVQTILGMTGRRADYSEWFDVRLVLGEASTTEALQLVGDVDSPDGESLSMLKLMDDGRLDERLLVELVQLHRPMGEIVDVVALDFLDLFDSDLSRSAWETVDRTGAEWTAWAPGGYAYVAGTFGDGVLTLDAGAAERALVPLMSVLGASAFGTVALAVQFTIAEDGDALCIRFHDDGAGHWYDLVITADASAAPIHLRNEVDDTYWSFPWVHALPAGTEHWARIVVTPATGRNWLDLYIDGELVFHVGDTEATRSTGGGFALAADDGPVTINAVEFSRLPGRWARVKPNRTLQATSNFFLGT